MVSIVKLRAMLIGGLGDIGTMTLEIDEPGSLLLEIGDGGGARGVSVSIWR